MFTAPTNAYHFPVIHIQCMESGKHTDNLNVYHFLSTAKKSVKELRQLCFRMKDEVFANPTLGVVFDSEALEKMLIDALGTDMKMGEVKHPK